MKSIILNLSIPFLDIFSGQSTSDAPDISILSSASI
jgi:hypothetical protein